MKRGYKDMMGQFGSDGYLYDFAKRSARDHMGSFGSDGYLYDFAKVNIEFESWKEMKMMSVLGIGKVGPILPSFQHAPCNPKSLQASTKSVDLSVDWSQASGNR